jgi:hypothetical protein
MSSLTPDRVSSHVQVSPIHVAKPSSHSAANHLVLPIIAFPLFTQRDGLHISRVPLPLALSEICLDFAIP